MEFTTTEHRTCHHTIHGEYEDADDQCGWTGNVTLYVYKDETWQGVTWTCPACGYEYEEAAVEGPVKVGIDPLDPATEWSSR